MHEDSHVIAGNNSLLLTQVCKLADHLYGAKPERSPKRTQLSKLVSTSQRIHVGRCDRSNTLFRARVFRAQSAQDRLHCKPVCDSNPMLVRYIQTGYASPSTCPASRDTVRWHRASLPAISPVTLLGPLLFSLATQSCMGTSRACNGWLHCQPEGHGGHQGRAMDGWLHCQLGERQKCTSEA